MSEYGALRDLVQIIPAREIAEIQSAENGWWSQQALKLEVARHVTTSFYLILDCKHHLVRPLKPEFVRHDGRLRVRAADYTGHPLISQLTAALTHFGLSMTQITFFPTTTPPFPFDVATALACTDYAKRQAGTLIAFMQRNNITEFFLYSAYLASRDRLTTVHELTTIPYPNFWPDTPSVAAATSAIAASKTSESPFLGVHRRALAEANQTALGLVADYWVACGLVSSRDEAFRLLRADTQGWIARIKRKLRRLLTVQPGR